MTTIAHLSATTRDEMLQDSAEEGVLPSAEGLIVNPVSIPTRFGSALPMLIHNRMMAKRLGLEHTHIYLASPYLYAFEAGLDQVIAKADCGLPAVTYRMHSHWFWHQHAAADQQLSGLIAHCKTDILVGRADGVFLPVGLFDEMLTLLHRFYEPAQLVQPNNIYPLEEILFPTILPAILGRSANIAETRARVWENSDPPNAAKILDAIKSGQWAAGKRISQKRNDPARNAALAHLPGLDIISKYEPLRSTATVAQTCAA
jgi:hypothetical protein